MSAETLVERTTTQEVSSRQWLWRSLSLVIAAGIVLFMLSLVNWSSFWGVLRRLSPLSLAAAFTMYVLLNFFRSLRYVALLDRPNLPLRVIFPIALFHNLLVRLLPFKLGEVSYVVLMRNRLSIPVKEGVSSLFGSRLLELLVMVLVFAVSLLLSGDLLEHQRELAVVLAIGSIAIGIVGLYFAGDIIRFNTRFTRRILSFGWIASLCNKLDSLALELDTLRQPRRFARALLWSCCTYGSSFAVNTILLKAIGLDVPPATWVVLISLGMAATAFPINISGFGAVELSWTFGLTMLAGYVAGEAASIGLTLNGYQLLCAAVSGLIGYAVVQFQGSKRKNLS